MSLKEKFATAVYNLSNPLEPVIVDVPTLNEEFVMGGDDTHLLALSNVEKPTLVVYSRKGTALQEKTVVHDLPRLRENSNIIVRKNLLYFWEEDEPQSDDKIAVRRLRVYDISTPGELAMMN